MIRRYGFGMWMFPTCCVWLIRSSNAIPQSLLGKSAACTALTRAGGGALGGKHCRQRMAERI